MKKIETLEQVKETLKNYNEPITIKGGFNNLEYSSNDALYTCASIINVSRMALEGLTIAYGSSSIDKLHITAETDLLDVSKCLEIATSLLPVGHSEIFEQLSKRL